MFNDDTSRQQSQGQGAFVRRPIPKYNEEKPSYQGSGGQGYSSGYNGGYNNGGQQRSGGGGQSYSRPVRRNLDGGGSSGGYSNNYRGGSGYNSRNNSYGAGDRLSRQCDTIIKLLREIISRLPASSGVAATDSYGGDSSYAASDDSNYDVAESDSNSADEEVGDEHEYNDEDDS